MANSPIALVSDPDRTLGMPSKTAAIWQAWTRKCAQHAPMIEQVQDMTKKVNLNVTQTILLTRQVNILTFDPENPFSPL